MALPMIVSTKILCSGCNRTNFSLDWGRNGLIAYGSCSSAALYQPMTEKKNAEILCTLVGHKKRVNCVKWIEAPVYKNGEDILVSGSVDNTAIVWKQVSVDPIQCEISATLKGHTGAVTSLAAIKSVNDAIVIATTSADFSVRIWEKHDTDYCESQVLSYGNGFALDVDLLEVPGLEGCLLLACAVTDHSIHLYARSPTQPFSLAMKLRGHEDWPRCVKFTIDDNNDVLLASSAQDHMIRVWRIKSCDTSSSTNNSEPYIGDIPVDQDIKPGEDAFFINTAEFTWRYVMSLETVLSGHDNWVYSVCWKPPTITDQGRQQEMCLLSTSMDKTMIIWRPDVDTGVWIEQVRVGEVGGNTLGFYGGVFSPSGDNILAHGYHGALHQWSLSKDMETCSAVVTVKGHFDGVVDIAWDIDGQYLLTTSLDQNTRLYAPCVKQNQCFGWYEIARPQIHGYDMQCLAVINPLTFASGADEKVIRIFEAASNFIDNFHALSGCEIERDKLSKPQTQQPEGASVPALGLSNKAIFTGSKTTTCGDLDKMPVPDQMTELNFTSLNLTEPPTEEHLLQNTLWPETQKLYAHSYELYSLASNSAGTLLASASKATKPEYARVILWDTSTWKQVSQLDGPSLTVTQLQFSHDDQYLLVVSRDRTWHLYRTNHDKGDYSLVASNEKKTSIHGRIIWSCCWSHDDVYFCTSSRDKKVAVWRRDQQTLDTTNNVPCGALLNASDSVTAVDMAPVMVQQRYMVAVGLECGVMSLHSWSPDSPNWMTLHTLDNRNSHTLTVKRLRFRPLTEDRSKRKVVELASCSMDYSVRLYHIDYNVVSNT